MLRRFRKSGHITLVLIGAAALTACGGDDTRRDVYKSREDCLADWGNKPEDCKPATESRHRGLGYFYGPAYIYHSGGSGSAWTRGSRASHAIGSTSPGSVSRGGFGSTGHSASG
jgi:uncharacterized protein YgiB involved in biofilm formation